MNMQQREAQRFGAALGRQTRWRRWRSLWAVLGIGALLLVGGRTYERVLQSEERKASPKGDPDAPPGAAARPVEIVEEGTGYRVVRHALGTTRAPAAPERICALAFADELLSVGVMPVACSSSTYDVTFPDYLAEKLRGVASIRGVYGDAMPNLEAIIRAKPDLILSRAANRQTYVQLSKIAPVVVLLDQVYHYRQRVLDIGLVVGRRREAEARVTWYEAKVRAASKTLRARLEGRTIAFLRFHPRLYYMAGRNNAGGPVLYGDLGLPAPRLLHDRPGGIAISPETLIDVDADHLIVAVNATAGTVRSMRGLLDHQAWDRMPAIKNNRALMLANYRHWAESGILGKSLIIEDVLRAVAPEAVEAVNAEAAVELHEFPELQRFRL